MEEQVRGEHEQGRSHPPGHLWLRLSSYAVVAAMLSHTRADPDLWGHVRFGQDTIREGLSRVDRYSFTADQPWINHEWLSEVAMSWAHAVGGSAGLVGLKILLVVTALAAASLALRSSRIRGIPYDLVLFTGAIGIFPQTNHVRPQLFSLGLFAVVLLVLREVDRGRRAALWALPLIFAPWANLHGGWVVGVGVIAMWMALTVGRGAVSASDRIRNGAATLLAVAATLATPYGAQLWTFLWNTVGLSRADITDWQPVYAVGPGITGIWLLVLVSAFGAARRASGVSPWSHLVIVGTLGAASFLVNRLLAFFAIGVVVFLGPALAEGWERLLRRRERPGAPNARVRIAAAIVATVLLVGSVSSVSRSAACVRVEPGLFPEPDVVSLIRQRRLSGRMIVWFDWGEYVIWYLAPAVSVSIDGRRETIYSDAVRMEHLLFYFHPDPAALPDWVRQADYAWLPRELPAVRALTSAGWTARIQGPVSVLLARSGGPAEILATTPQGLRCFPAP